MKFFIYIILMSLPTLCLSQADFFKTKYPEVYSVLKPYLENPKYYQEKKIFRINGDLPLETLKSIFQFLAEKHNPKNVVDGKIRFYDLVRNSTKLELEENQNNSKSMEKIFSEDFKNIGYRIGIRDYFEINFHFEKCVFYNERFDNKFNPAPLFSLSNSSFWDELSLNYTCDRLNFRKIEDVKKLIEELTHKKITNLDSYPNNPEYKIYCVFNYRDTGATQRALTSMSEFLQVFTNETSITPSSVILDGKIISK